MENVEIQQLRIVCDVIHAHSGFSISLFVMVYLNLLFKPWKILLVRLYTYALNVHISY